MNNGIFFTVLAIFIIVTLLLGWYGYKHTKNSDEFLLGRSKTSPMIIALSYGAAFLSASAIVGFGGQSAKFGMSMVWLVFLNLFMGLVVAFIIFGKRTRKYARKEKSFTFADFLGKRFQSSRIRLFASIIILVGMPVYCAAVLLGGVNFMYISTGLDRNLVLLVLSLVVAVYVTYGGIIAVMYNDALQAAIMFAGMAIILVVTFTTLGGVETANSALTSLWDMALVEFPDLLSGLAANGMNGWTSFSTFGSEIWVTVVTTFLLGVGIGALSQPQLVVRFMSAKSDRDLDKSLIIGSIFMLVIVGTAYTVGALSNVFFYDSMGTIAIGAASVDTIIPTFVTMLFENVTFGDLFISIFVLAIVCASISTLGALLHTMGSAGGYDLRSVILQHKNVDVDAVPSLRMNRICTLIMMVIVVVLAYLMPDNIIAKATSIFMGFTAATLLAPYAYSLFVDRPDKRAAFCSIAAGGLVWVVWGFLFFSGITDVLGYSSLISGSLLALVDPLIFALPASVIVLLVVAWSGTRSGSGEVPNVESAE